MDYINKINKKGINKLYCTRIGRYYIWNMIWRFKQTVFRKKMLMLANNDIYEEKDSDKIWRHRKKISDIYKPYGLLANGEFAIGKLSRGISLDLKYDARYFPREFGGFSFQIELLNVDDKNLGYQFVKGKKSLYLEDLAYEARKYFLVPLHSKVTKHQAHKIGKFVQQYETIVYGD